MKGDSAAAPYWTPRRLVPNAESGVSHADEIEWQEDLLIWEAAGEIPSEFERFINQKTLLDVYRILTLRRASNYTPPRQ